MSYHRRPHELRLAISFEAEALIAEFGAEAHIRKLAGARRRQQLIPGEGIGAKSR